MYLKYLRSLMRHRWYVFVECCKAGIPWLGIIHDLSKFLPSEFIPYARYFYGNKNRYPSWLLDEDFDVAWLHHQHKNKHHWQRWLLTLDSARSDGKIFALPMPDKYRKEMVADWRGAGRAYGNPDTWAWYVANREKIRLHPNTRLLVERELHG